MRFFSRLQLSLLCGLLILFVARSAATAAPEPLTDAEWIALFEKEFAAHLAKPDGSDRGLFFQELRARSVKNAQADWFQTPQRPVGSKKDQELWKFHNTAGTVYHIKHEREAGLQLFKDLEAQAWELKSASWLATAYWKQAQVWDDQGETLQTIYFFEQSRRMMALSGPYRGGGGYMLLLSNLFESYRSRGQLGEALQVHHALESSAMQNLAKATGAPVTTLLADFTDEQLKPVPLEFIGNYYTAEIALRFEAGDDAGALALAEKIDRRLTGTTLPREISRLAEVLDQIAEIHAAAGRTQDYEATLLRILVVAKERKAETQDELNMARIRLALLRCRQGIDPDAQFAEAQAGLDALKLRLWTPLWLRGRGLLARMHAQRGDTAQARETIDAAITETRAIDSPPLLAELLLTRAELQLDAGSTTGVKADLFEAVKLYRQMGGLRAETNAYVLYARFMRATDRPAEAARILALASTRLKRFPAAWQSAVMDREAAALAIKPTRPAPSTTTAASGGESASTTAQSDLQPIELTTHVAAGWTARGRFTLTNPGNVPVGGVLMARGANLAAEWDAAHLQWNVTQRKTTGLPQVSQQIVLQPLDQATVVVSATPAQNASGEMRLVWKGEAGPQEVWWHYTQSGDAPDLAVIDANLALENPFYSVPLHHFIARTDPARPGVINLRVVTSSPSRVELVDAATGRVLAVDATGNGDFRGIGDIIFDDRDRDGFPDIAYEKDQAVHAIEIQVYPLARYEEVGVKLELRQPDGTWELRSTDRLLGQNQPAVPPTK